MKAEDFLADFDSATGMVRALGRFLHGRDFPGLGIAPTWLAPVGRLVNALPEAAREQVYIWSGWSEAIAPEKLGDIRAEAISRWVVGQYPRRCYPAAVVGSASGALVHLCAALGIPWLPVTTLIPVRRAGVPPDEPRKDLAWGLEPGRALLRRNPELELHHMHDPNQDRLMVQRMTYFRVKRLRLGETYARWLRDVLAPGATLFLSECRLTWPTTAVAERHVFQFGALGGASPAEYHQGGPRVRDYLRRYRSYRTRWDPPTPDAERPEAEWGFPGPLRADVERFAHDQGYPLRRVVFDEPEDLSPLVADLYRWWYRERGLPADRLLVESFILLEPWWALRTGSVPFWMVFNKEPSLHRLQRYLEAEGRFDEIYLMLFSHGVESVGLASIEQWRAVLRRARRRGAFVGVDERAFPRDFATFVRYYTELQRTIRTRTPLPRPLALSQLDAFLGQEGHRYPGVWVAPPMPTSPRGGASDSPGQARVTDP